MLILLLTSFLLLQTEAVKDWTPYLLLSNVLTPVLSGFLAYRYTLSKTTSEAHKTDTESNILSVGKLVELMELIEKAQLKFLAVKEQYGDLERDFEDFRLLAERIFDTIEEIADCDDPRLAHAKLRIQLLREDYPIER